MDLAAHQKHLEIVLGELDSASAPSEEVLICYYHDSLRSSIQAQTDKQVWDLNSWEEAIKNAIDVESKAARQPQSLMREVDNWCLWGHRLVKFDEPTKESKDFNKDSSRPQKPKAQAPQHSDNAETSEKARKEKKNNRRHQKDHWASQDGRP